MVGNPENTMPNNQAPKRSPLSEQLVKGMLEDNQRFRKERREKVAQAKQNTPGKQPFDIETLGGMYDFRDDDGKLRITPELVEEFEAEYYLKNPDITSLEEFAERRRKLDEQGLT